MGFDVRSVRVGRSSACLLTILIAHATFSPSPVDGRAGQAAESTRSDAAPAHADVVVYGGTPSGVLAATTAARAGAGVLLIEPSAHVGGMVSNGLTATDYGTTSTIGGYTREFFDRVQAIEGTSGGRYRFQPSTAERVYNDMLTSAGVTVLHGERLHEGQGVTKQGTHIASIKMESGTVISGDVFIDASYEGDLMAAAGVSYRVGRESRDEFGESLAGVRPASSVFTPPTGTALGFPTAPPPGPVGSADDRVQVANFRPCFSTAPGRIRFSAPEGYDPATYDVIAAYIAARVAGGQTPLVTWFLWPVALPSSKFDVNNNGTLGIALYGANYTHPDGTYAERDAIAAQTRAYSEGFLYFLANDPRVPATLRTAMNRYGLCADEFVDNDNWPRLLYQREGRRMVGTYMLKQRDVEVERTKPDTIAIASYPLDTHHVSRWVQPSGQIRVEGGFWTSRSNATLWSIPYRSLTPSPDEATNLLVSVTASASHVAWASLRMEPQFMMMGEAAGQAAAISAASAIPARVQSVHVPTLQAALRGHGAIVDNPLFTDIVGSEFRGDIEATFKAGMVFGCSSTRYCPTIAMSREVMAAFLHRTLQLPPATRDHFVDDNASPYHDSINRLAEAGLTGGCATNRFCPTSTMTRGQMAAFLVRSFRLPSTTRDFFTDDATSIFRNDINRLAASGVTGGCGSGRFCPTRTVTRGEMAAFLWRASRL